MASPQPRHGELRSHRYKHWRGRRPKLRWASCTRYSVSYVPKETFGLLPQAVQYAVTLSDDEALQLIEGAPDESQDAGDSDSDEYYPSFTISTPLAPDNPPRSTVAVSAPQREVENAP